MINPNENEWSRFHQIREDLSELSASEVLTRIDQLRDRGEAKAVVSMLELHFRLAKSPALRAGRRLANRYTIKQKIGEGGMGVVYRAVQALTQQEVALKVIHPSLVSSRLADRFREEIRTLGRLQHDHIVRVFDADQDREETGEGNLLFYAMQLVDGLPLTRWVAERHPTTEQRLECFVRISEAVEHAHRRGVVHRDLKPDNILVDTVGRPAILDFGLAHIADVAFEPPKGPLVPEGETLLRVSGTPAFMSRERWEGRSGGVPADVFALGVLLHEMLTGTRPWKVEKDSPINDLRKAICDFSPEQLDEHPRLSRPLRSLIAAMLAADLDIRPASAAEVADRVRSILTRRRFKRRIRRTAPIWASIAAAVISVTLTQVYYSELRRVERESVTRLLRASQFAEQRDRADSLDRVIELLPPEPRLRHSQDEWRDVVLEALSNWNLHRGHAMQLRAGFEPIVGGRDANRFLGLTPDGSWQLIQRGDADWETYPYPGDRDLLRVRIHPGRPLAAVLSADQGLLVWEWASGHEFELLASAGTDAKFEFSPDGRYLACSATVLGTQGSDLDRLSEVRVFDTLTWRELAVLVRRGEPVEPGSAIHVWSRLIDGLAFSPDGRYLATWSLDSLFLTVWEWADARLIRYAQHTDQVPAASWRPSSAETEIATIQTDGRIRSWRVPAATDAAVYQDLAYAIEWGRTGPDFDGHLEWTSDGEALMAIEEGGRRLELFPPGLVTSGFGLSLTTDKDRSARWISGGLATGAKNLYRWTELELQPPIRRMVAVRDLTPSHLTFSPDGAVLCVSDSVRMVFVATDTLAVLGEMKRALVGPIAFDPDTRDLWAYDKNQGPVRWEVTEAEGAWTLTPVDPALARASTGELAVSGGNAVVSRGTEIYVLPKGQTSQRPVRLPAVTGDAPPGRLAIDRSGQLIAAIWLDPVRASLWQRQTNSTWRPTLRVTNAPVLSALVEWNRATPLTVPFAQRNTVEEKKVGSPASHFGVAPIMTPAASLPMVAWVEDPDLGVHLDYLGSAACIHIGTLPFGRDHRMLKDLCMSADGMQVATVSTSGAIHIWNLRRMLKRLGELELGVEGIDIETSDEAGKNVHRVRFVTPTNTDSRL